MAVLALIFWSATALAGLFLLAIWLIEYHPDFQGAAATRLRVPVIAGHVLFAVGGLVFWVLYMIMHKTMYSWIAAGALAVIATLGLTMAMRWVGVYRAWPSTAAMQARAADAPGPSGRPTRPGELAIPPERYFPVPAVIAHGFLAVTTLILVMLTVAGVGPADSNLG